MTTKHTSVSGPTLAQAKIGEPLVVTRVHPSPIGEDWERWLEEIGFLPGEHVQLIARGIPGGEPLAVRVGQSTFALRKAEAACIEVAREESIA